MPTTTELGHLQRQTNGAIDRLSLYLDELPHSQFRTTLLAVNRKFPPALRACKKNQKEYYFWVCDHVSAIARALDMFGPVPRPQFIRDPLACSWILVFVEPILMFALDATPETPLNAAQATYFTEMCVFLSSTIVQYRKTPCFYKDFVESVWDILTEIVQESHQTAVIKYSFNVLHTILARVPLCADLVCKVVLLRSTTLNYDEDYMVDFRLMHCKMFHSLVTRSVKAHNQQFLDDMRAEMTRCMQSESDNKVVQSLLKTLGTAKMPEQTTALRSLQDFKSVDHLFDHPNHTESSLDDSTLSHARSHNQVRAITHAQAQSVSIHSSQAQVLVIYSSGTPSLRTNTPPTPLLPPTTQPPPRWHSPILPSKKSLLRIPKHQKSWMSLANPHHTTQPDSSAGYKEFNAGRGRAAFDKVRNWCNSIFV